MIEIDSCEQLLEELKKWDRKESEHVKELLRLTFNYRREAYACTTIQQIILDFPQLEHFGLVRKLFFFQN